MPSLKQLHAELAPLGVRFLFVYTLEAHACDEWPISSGRFNPGGEPVTISKHQNLAERRAAAQRFKELFEVPFPIAVDTMEGDFESQFSTWPFRFYLIKDGLVSFQAQPRKCSYDIAELRERALLLGRHQEIE